MDLPLPAPPADPRAQAQLDRQRLRRAALCTVGFVAVLWWIKGIELWLGTSFGGFGNRPGELWGLVGIVTAPLLHGSIAHLVSNTLPLLLLGTLALVSFPRAMLRTLPLVWLLSGVLVWLLARPSFHIGASGLNHGLMFFLLTLGLFRRDRVAVATAFIAFFMYGGMLLTVLPREAGISWEYHLYGALAGVIAGLLWRRLDPLPPRKRYSWELEEEAELHPDADVFEPPRPGQVPVLWHRPEQTYGQVLPFRPRPGEPGAPPSRGEPGPH
jgi:membrane associated rhomboid family serine protease